MIERKVGEVFQFRGVTLKVESSLTCNECYFNGYYASGCCPHGRKVPASRGQCSANRRTDNQYVQFVEEKGEKK